MTGYEILTLVAVLYLLFELGAIPLGHAIGKRVSVTRIVMIIIAALYVAYRAVVTYLV